MKLLVPADFDPPELKKADYTLRPLRVTDIDADYAAIMANIGLIRRTRGGDWPEPTLTKESDLADLGWHQREHEFKTNFCFVIEKDGEYLGSVYLYAPGEPMSDAASVDDADVIVSWWVIQEAYDRGLYQQVGKDLREWLSAEWPFERVYFANTELPDGIDRYLERHQ